MIKKIIGTMIVIIMVLFTAIYWLAFDVERLSNGELISEERSPQGTYTVKAYLVNPHATVSYAVRGELHFNNTKARHQTIYWNYREETAEIEWVEENLVRVNGIAINVPYGLYDFRR